MNTEETVAVLTDFGVSRIKSGTQTQAAIGTIGFMAPEIIGQQEYSEMCDVSEKMIINILQDERYTVLQC